MKSMRIGPELDQLAALPGVVACALVDAATGLVWHVSGDAPRAEHVWEAAVDYWRLHDRHQAHFAGLGALGAVGLYHTAGVLAILPCAHDPEVLLVALAEHRAVDWIALQRMARTLGQRLHARVSP